MGNHDVMAQDILNHGANEGNQELPLVCEEGTTLTYTYNVHNSMLSICYKTYTADPMSP